MIVANQNEGGAAKKIAYIEEMLQELVKMAADADYTFLAYLLEIAHQEALSAVITRGKPAQ